VAAHDTAATWLMNMLTPSPFLISVLATVASLPFFLFTLPAGALADIVDRKKFLCLINLWLAVAAAALAILGWLHLLNPYVILTSVFVIGVGFALNAPAWTSSVSEVVSNVELPSAGILGGLQLNISGIIGPALGGLLVPVIGLNFVFAVNAACFLVVILAVLQWKRTNAQSRIGLERFFESLTTAIRYVRYAPGLQVVLARNALFALFISVIPALMPVVGLKALHLNPSQLGLLFTSMGVGSVAGAVFNESVRKGRDRGRIEIEGSGKVDREWTGQSKTNQEQNGRSKQRISRACRCDSVTPDHPAKSHSPLRNHDYCGVHAATRPTGHRALRRYPEFGSRQRPSNTSQRCDNQEKLLLPNESHQYVNQHNHQIRRYHEGIRRITSPEPWNDKYSTGDRANPHARE
jgi:hypothetical protein